MFSHVTLGCSDLDRAAGARDEGPPGERAHYGAGYYGAYFRDLDGNKVHVVHRGDVE